MKKSTAHFVLVHGACHGAWCWYKLTTLLKSSGYRVTAVDLGGCGVNPKRTDEIATVFDYSQPLMEFMASVPCDEKVILVGHSYSGLVISLAMESFPDKISVAVFIAAYMPSYKSPPASYIHEYLKRTPMESLMDSQFFFDGGMEKPPTSVKFGPNYMTAKVYQHCPPEDLELAKTLIRPNGLFVEDLTRESLLTEEKFGSVDRVFVMCGGDEVMGEEVQRWMIENGPGPVITEVKLIEGAGHMVMLSKPKELCLCFQQIAAKYH
ncbi:methylesterase 10 [Malania oleifera]|uniref:methylesterase 10 n=1 Tax=Malania oleifera TaxID=397392 RepID=UPI0025AE2151|nr:methylesterase 10 [Malania oleifera]